MATHETIRSMIEFDVLPKRHFFINTLSKIADIFLRTQKVKVKPLGFHGCLKFFR